MTQLAPMRKAWLKRLALLLAEEVGASVEGHPFGKSSPGNFTSSPGLQICPRSKHDDIISCTLGLLLLRDHLSSVAGSQGHYKALESLIRPLGTL